MADDRWRTAADMRSLPLILEDVERPERQKRIPPGCQHMGWQLLSGVCRLLSAVRWLRFTVCRCARRRTAECWGSALGGPPERVRDSIVRGRVSSIRRCSSASLRLPRSASCHSRASCSGASGGSSCPASRRSRWTRTGMRDREPVPSTGRFAVAYSLLASELSLCQTGRS